METETETFFHLLVHIQMPAKSSSWELHEDLSHGWQGPKQMSHHPLVSQVPYQCAGLEPGSLDFNWAM